MRKTNKTLSSYTKEVVAIFKEYKKQGTKPWTYDTAVRDLPYQIGSLTKAIMQLRNERYPEGLSKKELIAKVADELADIFAETLFIAHELGISLEDAWTKMLESDKTKIKSRSK